MSLQTHEHEWRLKNHVPIVEDGKAIFQQECGYAEVVSAQHSERHDETFYGYGAECEEENQYVFRAERAERKQENGDNIEYNYAPFEAIEDAEINGEIKESDPDENFGRVVMEGDEWIVIYKP